MRYHHIEDPQDHAYERILALILRFNQEIGKNYEKYLKTFLNTSSNIASGAAAFLSLPKESGDRRAVIEAFLQRQTRDFSDEALVALSDYLKKTNPCSQMPRTRLAAVDELSTSCGKYNRHKNG